MTAVKDFELTADMNLGQLVDEAVEFLRHYEPVIGYYLGFSGGKDSIVTYDIAKRADVKIAGAFYSQTHIDPPELVRFIKQHYPEVHFLKPTMTFWQGMLEKNVPLRGRRWCCDVLKKNPGKDIPLPFRVMGIRAEESHRRRKRGRIDYWSDYGQFHFHPIYNYSSVDVWDYIKMNGLPYPSLYDEGFGRLGCVVCPFVDRQNLKRHKARWPGMYRILEKYLDKVWAMNCEKEQAAEMTYEQFMKWPEWPSKLQREYARLQGVLV